MAFGSTPQVMLSLTMVTVVVDDYDEAIAHYVEAWGFTLVEDSPRGEGKR
jgi:catechol 2,3-dioxygenase-like lactoylglutathione lyase family enzyme